MTGAQIEKEARELKKQLKTLVDAIEEYIYLLDKEMLKPSSPERGGRIARLSNALNMAKDMVRYSGLGIDFRKDKPFEERMAKRFSLKSKN